MSSLRVALLTAAIGGVLGFSHGSLAQQSCGQMNQAHQELMSTMNQCQAEMNRHLANMSRLAPQGIILPPPQCTNMMPQWIAQTRYVEARLGHCAGDPRSLCEQQGYPRGCEAYRQP